MHYSDPDDRYADAYFDAAQSIEPCHDSADECWYYFDVEQSQSDEDSADECWYYFDAAKSDERPIWHDAEDSFAPKCLSLIEKAFYLLIDTVLRAGHALLMRER